MSFTCHTCVVPTCDTCGDGWGEDGAWHFATTDEALAYLRSNQWIVTEHRLVCQICAIKADCDATGHQHQSWESNTVNGVVYRQRLCEHCGGTEYQPPFEE